MAKCLVTGGAGFVGSNLVDELINQGDEVIVIDNLATGKREQVNSKANFYKLDLRNLEDIKSCFIGVDYVFHEAALARVQPSIEDPIKYNDNNVNAMLNVLVAARDAKVKKVIYASSSSIYGNQKKMPLTEDMEAAPISPYGLQKYIGEEYCRLFSYVYKLPTVCLRYFNVYGPRMATDGAYASVVSIFGQQRKRGEPMTVAGDGTNLRTYTFVKDIVRANILAAKSDIGDGRAINAGQSTEYNVNQIAEMLGGPVTNIAPRIEPKRNLCGNALAKKLLGWQPTMDLPEWLPEYKKEMGI
ncbi:MAG: NAD-dependent epimerase/dehydratase family protein [Patescibacteria group bacterium]|nr:NAD-dependent epimerase/dehydratase family protein [Patescibacteria group bacterium]MDD5554371.1 NAD-dependent epimerase/dehydratase family protein [Patescibacteria group bacterium]